MKFKKLALSIVIGTLFVNVPAWAAKPDISADKIVVPAPSDSNSLEAKRVTSRLIQSHYKKFSLDDALSEKILIVISTFWITAINRYTYRMLMSCGQICKTF